MTTNVLIAIAILAVCGITGFNFFHKKFKNPNKSKSTIDLITEYSGLINSLVSDSIMVLSVNHDTNEDEYKDKLAGIVANKFYEEIQSEEDLKNSLLAKLTENEIKTAILLFFQFDSSQIDVSKMFSSKKLELDTKPESEEVVEKTDTVDISDKI